MRVPRDEGAGGARGGAQPVGEGQEEPEGLGADELGRHGREGLCGGEGVVCETRWDESEACCCRLLGAGFSRNQIEEGAGGGRGRGEKRDHMLWHDCIVAWSSGRATLGFKFR